VLNALHTRLVLQRKATDDLRNLEFRKIIITNELKSQRIVRKLKV
jgi:hypothetical protein